MAQSQSSRGGLQVYVQEGTAAEVQVYNPLGQLVHRQGTELVLGENWIALNTSQLAEGLYLIQLETVKGRMTKRLLIK